ncbi:DNA mismatch repair protein MutL [Meredithblackwellia eburnea MCA 4105]
MSIKAIDQTSVHRITSGQVVVDLQTAVKELVENAFDAGATSIEVRFKEHGVESIEVQDNGRGIDAGDWPGIARKHHTSKLTSYADLDQVSTLGFRGEALSSLCGTAELSIVTATATTAPAATSLTFATSGECIVGGKVARTKGTTVTVKELFKHLPVRRKDLIKNAKREFGKAVDLLQAYAIVMTGCRIEVKNSTKGKWQTQFQTQASPTVRANFASLFTPKAVATMMDVDLVLTVEPDKSVLKWSEGGPPKSTEVRVKGIISKPVTGSGRSATNRQFFYVNGRPFSPIKVAKAVNDLYKTFNTGSFPALVADFQLPSNAYDVNVSPDKRTIFLHSEANLIAALNVALEDLFQPSRSTFSMSQIGAAKATPATKSRAPSPDIAGDDGHEFIFDQGSVPPEDHEVDEGEPPRKRRRMSSTSRAEQGEEVPQDSLDSPNLTSSGSQSSLPARSSSPTVAPRFMRRASADHDPLDRNRSSSPGPPKMRQVTLDTSLAIWSQASQSQVTSIDNRRGTKKPLDGLKAAAKGLRQFLNPSQIKPLAQEADPEEDEEDQDQDQDRMEMYEGEDAFETVADELEEDEEEVVRPGRRRSLHGDSTLDFDEPQSEEEEPTDLDLAFIDDASVDETYIPNAWRQSDDLAGEAVGEVELDDLLFVDGNQAPGSQEWTGNHGDQVNVSEKKSNFKGHRSSSCCGHSETLDLTHDESDTEDSNVQHGHPITSAIPPSSTLSAPYISSMVDSTVSVNITTIARAWEAQIPARHGDRPNKPPHEHSLIGASVGQDDEQAEEVLSRVVSKDDFEAMDVVGQFNLGFIIVRRRVGSEGSSHDDLFIVDQHASDEKYNFETLQRETVIQSQRLLQPRPLNLPSHEEITAMENVEILKMNGFEVQVDEEAKVGERVKLLAQPVSKDTTFGVDDLEELLDLIESSAAGEVVRPTKTRKMFASRACRKSVMIGKALTKTQMTSVVRHMGGMDQPWSCPHGRPTMRWLAGLGTLTRDSRSDLLESLQQYE